MRTWQGSVIRAIVTRGKPLTWTEIQELTGLGEKPLNRALRDLHGNRIINKIEDIDGFSKYQIFDELQPLYSEIYNPRTALNRWIGQWKGVKNLDFSEENEHFFLERRHLDDFSKELIAHASFEVLVANPYIQECDLSNTLLDAKKKRINVSIITRPPTDDKHPEYVERKREYHLKLRKEGIALLYEPKVHAKLIVVDRAVAIVSSMNFYGESSAGVSWEAGIVTLESKVVESILSSYSKAFTDASSSEIKEP